jgi:hypothetical protein
MRKTLTWIIILFSLVACSTDSEEDGYCSIVYEQRDAYEVDLDKLLRELETGLIDEQSYTEQKNEILRLIFELEESNSSCFTA